MKRWRYAGWIILLVLVVAGAARLRFDVEILNLLPQGVPVVDGLRVYQENFSNARELLITVKSPDGDGTEQAAQRIVEALRAASNLVAYVSWKPAWMEHPDETTELIGYLWFNRDPGAVAGLAARLSGASLTNVLRAAKEELATTMSPGELGTRGYDPFGIMHGAGDSSNTPGSGEELFASADGTFRVMFVEARGNIVTYRECREWLRQIQALIERMRSEPDFPPAVVIKYTGRPAFVTEIAGGMEQDMLGSASGTLLIIGILFYLTHRRLRPLVWLLAILAGLLGATMALGGLVFGTLNVVSMGFASILAGLSEDFGIVLYQESRSHPHYTVAELRRLVGAGIFWSAITTAGAFLMLNFSGLPGLGQLGTLVAIGIILAAIVMVYGYAALVVRFRRPGDAGEGRSAERFLLFKPGRLLPERTIRIITIVVAIAAVGSLLWGGPRFDRSPDPLKPRNSEAYRALDEIRAQLGRMAEPLWVLIPGNDEREVRQKLDAVDPWLANAAKQGQIRSYNLPRALWPAVGAQATNRAILAGLTAREAELQAAARGEGFTPESLRVTESVFSHWRRAVATTNVFWPTNAASRWVIEKVVARPAGGFLAIGLVHFSGEFVDGQRLAASVPPELSRQGVLISGWPLLGPVVFEMMLKTLPQVLGAVTVIVIFSLWLAFRRLGDVLVSLTTLGFSALILWGAMRWLGWDWNLMNLTALPLLLGMGVDFSIHLQLALQRYHGDLMEVRRSVGRALLLAGTTTVAGFGSLAFSSNLGLASLGKVCALGIGITLVVAVYLMPAWWVVWNRRRVDG